jgi:hypothetical protein
MRPDSEEREDTRPGYRQIRDEERQTENIETPAAPSPVPLHEPGRPAAGPIPSER